MLKLKNLDGIYNNFRVKKVYASYNLLENVDGLRKYKFLDTLLISNNSLRNLDKFLEFLRVKFAFLEQLDLYGNPLAEEPDYRLKIIHAMPCIHLLDRHMVTIEERIKAEKMYENLNNFKAKDKKIHITKAGPSQTFSKGEKDLYREVGELRKIEARKLVEQE